MIAKTSPGRDRGRGRNGPLLLAVFLGYCLVYIAPLGSRPLLIPDESRYGEIARELATDGHPLVMRQAGLPYYEKPPLGYWLNGLSVWLLGETPFAVRLPSALAAGGAAVAIGLFLRSQGRGGGGPILAVGVYLSCVQVFGIGTFAVLDAMFGFFVCLSMLFFFAGAGDATGRRWSFFVLAGLACGAAFLVKGFTALVVPAVTAALWLAWERRWRDLLVLWIVPVGVAAAAVLPVALLLHRANPDYWRYFFWTEHVQRFLQPGGGQHRQPVWFFLPIFLAGAMPWSLFLPAAAGRVRVLAGRESLVRFCLCWMAGPFLFFSLCGGKLPTYILPCFPPFAILMAVALGETPRGEWLRRGALAGAGLLVAALAGFFVWLALTRKAYLREALLGDGKTLALALAVLIAAGFLVLAATRLRNPDRRGWGFGLVVLSFCPLFLASLLLLPEGVLAKESPSPLLERAVALTPAGAILVGDSATLPSLCWHYRRDDAALLGNEGELEDGLLRRGDPDKHLGQPPAAAERIRRWLEEGRTVAVILKTGNYDHMAGLEPAAVMRTPHFVWARFQPQREIRE